MADTSDLADRLLEAHVRYAVDQLSGPEFGGHVSDVVDELLAAGRSATLNDVLNRSDVVRIARRLLATVPASSAAEEIARGAAAVLHAGPSEPFAAGDLISREHIERLVEELVAARPLIEKVLDELVESPLIAGVVSRFVGRVVGDVLGTHRTAAAKVPGVGGLLGTASKVVGAGASGVEQLLGSTAGKGAQIAARRLNKVAVDTLQDPQFTAALMQLWDQRSDTRVRGVSRIASLRDTERAVGLIHDVAVGALGSAPVADLAGRLVDMVFDLYGDSPVTTILTGLGVDRDDLIADAHSVAAGVVSAGAQNGTLEAFVRARLAPFYRSAEFRAAVG